MSNYLIIANWKMNLSFHQEADFIKTNANNLISIAEENNVDIVLSPSFLSSYFANTIFDGSKISIAAQNCSSHLSGNFTGDISAKGIHQVGCKYCIIGHSERRDKESNHDIAKKFVHLIDYDISPILCIGETEEEYVSGNTIKVLESQLKDIFEALNTIGEIPSYLKICITYEPVWSVGTGKIPEISHLESVFAWLKKKIMYTKGQWYKLLYGGSVDKDNIDSISSLDIIDGFLVGGASTNFEELTSIVNKLNR